jgi:fumarylacetoacetate (FAA) hydrolase
MRLATRNDGSRDGELVVVAGSGDRYLSARGIAPHLQAALDAWDEVRPELEVLAAELAQPDTGLPLDFAELLAPLPRAYEWIDGSAFIHHVELARKARGAALPATLLSEPLVYQGGSSRLLGPRAPVPLLDPGWGLDFEAEVAVIVGDTELGTPASSAREHIKLLVLANDWTLRNLVPGELDKGFGFFISKPATAFSPFAVTPDELGSSFRDGRVHLCISSYLNECLVGNPDAGPEMHFSFFDLLAHAVRTRSLGAGTIVGSGTVSNRDPKSGVSCLVEQRMRETIDFGAPRTGYLTVGDRVRIEMLDAEGKNLFGSIDQRVIAA